MKEKIEALAEFLQIDASEIEISCYDDCSYDADGREYLVLTDEEADERATEYIKESAWAFNANFLAGYMPEGIDAEEIDAIRGDRCEDCNDAMLALIKAGRQTFQDFADDAIGYDGRGHFISFYDGEEHESGDFYIYRTN